MIYVVGILIAVLAFVSMYSAAVSGVRWFRTIIYTALSIVFAMLVTSNLF